MTPQEECLVLDLHSKWGNRWSRIARKLPGRTDNEIKNFWRTHMRKLAQEKNKKVASHHVLVSSSSSSPTDDLVPMIEIGEESFYDTGGDQLDYLGQQKELYEEENEKLDYYSYSMDDIWKDIDDQNVMKPVCDEQFSCGPVAESRPWEYGQYQPWKVDEDDNKLFAAMNIYDHGEAIALT